MEFQGLIKKVYGLIQSALSHTDCSQAIVNSMNALSCSNDLSVNLLSFLQSSSNDQIYRPPLQGNVAY